MDGRMGRWMEGLLTAITNKLFNDRALIYNRDLKKYSRAETIFENTSVHFSLFSFKKRESICYVSCFQQ